MTAQSVQMEDLPSIDDIKKAGARIQPYIHRTPVLRSNIRLVIECKTLFQVREFSEKWGIQSTH